jgi:hypothetical protein
MTVATEDDKANSPATTSMSYDYMAPKWMMISHLLGGTATMREAGQVYLPQHPHESDKNYGDRLNSTTLLNMTELTLSSLVGKPFSDPVQVKGLTGKLEKFPEDVDLQGNNMHVFCRQWFRTALAKSYAHVLIDMPQLLAPEDRQRSMADDKRENVRPYWSLISPENVIFISYVEVNGKPELDHVRIRENFTQRVGYVEVEVRRIRVLDRGWWELFEEVVDPKTKKAKWVSIDGGETGLDIIPMVTFFANEDHDLTGKPPLEDLAYLNVAHWQSMSDQRNILTVARFPMLAVSGAHDTPNNDVMVIGPRQLLATRAENGKFYYVEHTGKAIEAGAKDLEKLEQDMAAYGAEFLRKRPGGTTATARALDSAEATSPLQDMTERFIDIVEQALKITGQWLDEEVEAEVLITTDFGPEEVKDVDLRTLAEMRRNRDISREMFVNELKRRGALADDFDNEENVAQLENEPEIQSPFATGFNTDGSAGSNVDNSMKKPKTAKKGKKNASDEEVKSKGT